MARVVLPVLGLLMSVRTWVSCLHHCQSRTGGATLDAQCQKYCSLGQCPHFCLCDSSNGTDTCNTMGLVLKNKVIINETILPGTPILTIPVQGLERWSLSLERGGVVDGSVWNSLSRYLKLSRLGNQYEMIVDKTPDLEDIFQKFGIKLTGLNLKLSCDRDNFPSKTSTIFLQILPVNEYAPEFFITPLKFTVPENTAVGSEVYLLSDHAMDQDINPGTNELLVFQLWKYLPSKQQKDGELYFQLQERHKGKIKVKASIDYEALKLIDLVQLFLNISASDSHNLTTFTVVVVDVENVDDLPPEFYHPEVCQTQLNKSQPCPVSYEATIPLQYTGQVTNITPGIIQAKDMDGLNSPLEFSLLQGVGGQPATVGKFWINATTGSLFLISPFDAKAEVHLEVVVREVNEHSRSVQTSILVRVTGEISSAAAVQTPARIRIQPTRQEAQTGVEWPNRFMVATILLSLLAGLLLVALLVVSAKLRARTCWTSKVQPAKGEQSISDHSVQGSRLILAQGSLGSQEKNGDINNPVIVPSLSASSGEANSLETFSSSRQQQNIQNSGFISHLLPLEGEDSKVGHGQHLWNVADSASPLSKVGLDRTMLITVPPSDCTGRLSSFDFNDHQHADFSMQNNPIAGSSCVWRQQFIAISNNAYLGSSASEPSNIMILSEPSHARTNNSDCLRRHSQQSHTIDDMNSILTIHQSSSAMPKAILHSSPTVLYPGEDEGIKCKASGWTSDSADINIKAKDRASYTGSSSNTRLRQKANYRSSKKTFTSLRRAQSNRCSKESSDNYRTDEESDDIYRNDNSISENSGQTVQSSQGYADANEISPKNSPVPPSPVVETSLGNVSRIRLVKRSPSLHSPLLNDKKISEQSEASQWPECLIGSDQRSQNEVMTKETKPRIRDLPQISVTHSEEDSFKKLISSQQTRVEPTGQNQAVASISRPGLASQARKISRVNLKCVSETSPAEHISCLATPGKSVTSSSETRETKLNDLTADWTGSHHTLAETLKPPLPFSCQTQMYFRPHTSDGQTLARHTSSVSFNGRPSTSAPSRINRRNFKKKTKSSTNQHKPVSVSELDPARATFVPVLTPAHQEYLLPAVKPLRFQMAQPQLLQSVPWPVGYYLLPQQSSPAYSAHQTGHMPLSDDQNWQQQHQGLYLANPPTGPSLYQRHQRHFSDVPQHPMQQLYSVPGGLYSKPSAHSVPVSSSGQTLLGSQEKPLVKLKLTKLEDEGKQETGQGDVE